MKSQKKRERVRKALVILEQKKVLFPFSTFLRKINKIRNLMEIKLWVLPLIHKTKRKGYQITVVYPDNIPIQAVAGDVEKIITEERLLDKDIDYALTGAINLSREWHLYGELPSLLQIGGINFGEVVQPMMLGIFFNNYLKRIELANTILKEENPNVIYLQNNVTSPLRAFHAVAVSRELKHYFIEPKLYSELKNKLKLYSWEKIRDPFNIYLINKTRNKGSKYKILLDVPYINYFNAVFPVIWELLSQNICECYIIGKETDISKKFSSVKRLDVGSFDKSECKEKTRALRTYYHYKLKKDATFQSIFEYKGIKIWNIIKDDISHFFDKVFITLSLSTAYFQKVIDTVNPDILIVGDDRGISVRGHVLMAKKKGIPVLEIQHGAWIPKTPMGTPLSDKIAAGGDYYKKIYTEFGAREEQIIVTGWPKFDTYVKQKEALTEKHKNGTNILFATGSGDIKITLDTIEAIGSFIEDSTHFRLIVKPHPLENTKIYNQITKKYKNVILHKSSEDISSLIASSDILITVSSTVAIEAALLDKTIICLNVPNEEQIYVSSGIAIEVKNLEDLIPTIKNALYNEEVRKELAKARKKFVYEHAYIQDGQATKRAVDLIMRMIEESKKGVNMKPNTPAIVPEEEVTDF